MSLVIQMFPYSIEYESELSKQEIIDSMLHELTIINDFLFDNQLLEKYSEYKNTK